MALTLNDLLQLNNERFIASVLEKPDLLLQLDPTNDQHNSKLLLAVKSSYEFIKVLPKHLLTEQLLNSYLNKKLLATDSVNKQLVFTSLEDQTSFKISYSVLIDYIDSFIGIPTELQMNIEVKLKIISPLKFINAVDLGFDFITLENIYNYFTTLLVSESKSIISEYIMLKNISYYELPKYLTELSKNILSGIDIDRYGLSLHYCVIKDTKIPSNLKDMMFDGYFNNRQKELLEKFNQSKEEFALKMYKEKASICKETGYPPYLTEKEKDNAFDRYILKQKSILIDKDEKKSYDKEKLKVEDNIQFRTVTEDKLDIDPYHETSAIPWYLISILVSVVLGFIIYDSTNVRTAVIVSGSALIVLILLSLMLVGRINKNKKADYDRKVNAIKTLNAKRTVSV
ncbi:hypothetical protein N7548_01410 [Acholeplasma manati]|uniref:Uncharacterized protein n=1 Tax=Paracholeplasma manati TaxID=591373 RepID=A0ABT2Y422_9MOLU|nr:hypothetical protein [Paracholeplasma manati]MCV2231485.1 hypothetical protein [Paracholeplasma manati]